jgi:hypothetical protein
MYRVAHYAREDRWNSVVECVHVGVQYVGPEPPGRSGNSAEYPRIKPGMFMEIPNRDMRQVEQPFHIGLLAAVQADYFNLKADRIERCRELHCHSLCATLHQTRH